MRSGGPIDDPDDLALPVWAGQLPLSTSYGSPVPEPDTTAVSDFMSNLKATGKFKDVDIVVSRQAIDKTPSLVTFEVTCKFEI